MRRVIAYGIVVLVVSPIPLGVLWVLLTGNPDGYTRPEEFTTAELEAEAAAFVSVGAQFYNTVEDKSNQTPLRATLTDRMINGHIRTRSRAALKRLPRGVSNPQVLFFPDSVVLMAEAEARGVRAVVSIQASLRATDDGRLAARILSMKSGRLPMPTSMLAELSSYAAQRREELADELAAFGEPADRSQRKRLRALQAELELMRAAEELLTGDEVLFDPRPYHIHLDRLELGRGTLSVEAHRVDAGG